MRRVQPLSPCGTRYAPWPKARPCPARICRGPVSLRRHSPCLDACRSALNLANVDPATRHQLARLVEAASLTLTQEPAPYA